MQLAPNSPRMESPLQAKTAKDMRRKTSSLPILKEERKSQAQPSRRNTSPRRKKPPHQKRTAKRRQSEKLNTLQC